jgi:hypothetical protein
MSIWDYPRLFAIRRKAHLPALLLTLLAGCTNTILPNLCTTTTKFPDSIPPNNIISAALQESGPQDLVIRNQMPTPV